MPIPNAMKRRRHSANPPEDMIGDLLVGAQAINNFLIQLGMPEDTNSYYLRKLGHWPIGKTASGKGGSLIASKKKLLRHAQKITG